MKIRNGFVSNSSSSSFIVPFNCKEEAEKYGLELTSVKELKRLFSEIDKIGGSWIFDYNYRLEELKKLNDEDFISQPYDRDRAYRDGIDYRVFEGDL